MVKVKLDVKTVLYILKDVYVTRDQSVAYASILFMVMI